MTLSVFTLTNGFFAFVTIILIIQLTSNKILIPKKYTMIWSIGLIFLFLIYINGLPSSVNNRPNILDLGHFSFAYLGSSLSGLLHFPYRNMFWIPTSSYASVPIGIMLFFTAVLLLKHSYHKLKNKDFASMILWSFTIFSIMSAVITGWGRAGFDEYGPYNGNSSRYTIFGVYLIFGQLYYISSLKLSNIFNSNRKKIFIKTCMVFFIILSSITYYRAIDKIYKNSNQFNTKLGIAYNWNLDSSDGHKLIFPNNDFVIKLKKNLKKYYLHPYKDNFYLINLSSEKYTSFELIEKIN